MSNDQGPRRAVADDYMRLLSLAVHEFRTPASVVSGYLRMLLGEARGALTDHQRHMIEESEKSTERIISLIGELNEIVRLDAGTPWTAPGAFDVFEAAHEAPREVRNAEGRAVRVELRGQRAGARVAGDRARFSEALWAIVNAVAREQIEGSPVAIDCRLSSEDGSPVASLVVAGESDLESARTAPREPFDEERGGLGLSLPIARRIIDRHGGRVWSSAPGAPGDQVRRAAAVIVVPLT
jgi:signal transduction histidine kinase